MSFTPEQRLKGGLKAVARLASYKTPEFQSSAGKAAGKLAVETGQLDSIRNLPQTKAGQSRAGKVSGRKAVETGQILTVQKLGGKEQGARNKESGWMAHVQRFRWDKSHHDCVYCLNQQQDFAANAARGK
jgi:hypothetical protein